MMIIDGICGLLSLPKEISSSQALRWERYSEPTEVMSIPQLSNRILTTGMIKTAVV
jgi:hypothetical protein